MQRTMERMITGPVATGWSLNGRRAYVADKALLCRCYKAYLHASVYVKPVTLTLHSLLLAPHAT